VKYKNSIIIWVNYFNKELTKKEGRKLSKREAVKNPTLDELRDIAIKMGYKVIDIKKARYPSSWWVEGGYIVIDKTSADDKKINILRNIAKEMRRRRGG